MLKGRGVCAGCGMGSALLTDEADTNEKKLDMSNKLSPQEERRRFDMAKERFCQSSRGISKKLQLTAGKNEARIPLGHIDMVNDPYFTDGIYARIDGGLSARDAVFQVCAQLSELLLSSPDELTRGRADDISHIEKELINIMSGQKNADLSVAAKGTVIVCDEFTAAMAAQIVPENIAAIVAQRGGETSHSAIIARAMGIPTVLGVKDALLRIKNGQTVIVDGGTGEVVIDPSQEQARRYAIKNRQAVEERTSLDKYIGKLTRTSDGRRIELYANIAGPQDANLACKQDAEGIGLFRTEFLFLNREQAPSEDEQSEAYRRTAATMKNRPVIIRTLDIGGDKNAPYLDIPDEENPFLGFRAIRYCLKNEELFLTQLRALLRAGVYGDISIMLPLITSIDELKRAQELLADAKRQLERRGELFDDKMRVGVMIETPAAALTADILAKHADFFSIGTNDLTQYITAADRGNANTAHLYSAAHPAVLRAIKRTVRCAHEQGIPVGICGEAASDELLLPMWAAFEIDELSVSPSAILRMRRSISRIDIAQAQSLAKDVLRLNTAHEVKKALSELR